MISLQKFLFDADVSGVLDMTPSALYERQRALVRVGLLPAAASRGRNSGGAMATAETIAMIVLSILVTDSLSEVDERIATWANLRAIENHWIGGRPIRVGKCHFTKQRTLHKAMAAIMVGDGGNLAIEVNRKQLYAEVVDKSGQSLPSQFGRRHPGNGIQLKAEFGGLFDLGQVLAVIEARTEVEGIQAHTVRLKD